MQVWGGGAEGRRSGVMGCRCWGVSERNGVMWCNVVLLLVCFREKWCNAV